MRTLRSVPRRVVLIMATSLVLSGCAGAGQTEPASSSSESVSASTSVKVRHASGEATIPTTPVRIVETTGTGLGLLLSLGIAPVQTNLASNKGLQPFQEAALDRLGAKPELVRAPETSLSIETVAKAKPDLIVSESYYTDTVRDQLSQIAPVVDLYSSAEGGWRANLKMLGTALGMSEEANQLIADTDKRVAAVADNKIQDTTFAYVFNDKPGGTFGICKDPLYGPIELLTAIGLRQAAKVQQLPENSCTDVSLELVADTLASTDFIVVSELYDSQAGERFLTIPVVSALSAVKDKRYYIVPGPGGANSAMDQFSPYTLDVVLPELENIADAISRTT